MSVYARIFAATSKKFTSAAGSLNASMQKLGVWGVPAAVGFTWFIWGALTDDIKKSVGLYYDPDAVLKQIEAEREQRLEARQAAKPKKAEPDDDDEDEDDDDDDDDEEEEVTADTIASAVQAAVEASAGGDEDDDEDNAESTSDDADEDDEEEEEKPKKKKPKVDFNSLSQDEKWDYVANTFIEPGEDEEDDDDDDDDDVSVTAF
jgi:hypothetical protein